METKVIVIGASTVGKSTLLKYLKGSTKLPIDESDDVLTAMNGGVYPEDNDYKMNVLAPKMIDDVLGRDEVIFFSNTHYFTEEDLKKAQERGFRIIQLVVDKEEMIKRNRYRKEFEGYDDLSKYFDDMISYQKEIYEKGLVDAVIDTNTSVEVIAVEFLRQL
jgi:hypothetical protein